MKPTMSEQLCGMRRLLSDTVAPELGSGYPADVLRGVIKNLRMLEKRWDQVVPFLEWDIMETRVLLQEARPYVDLELQRRIASLDSTEVARSPGASLEDQANLLRGMLVDAMRQFTSTNNHGARSVYKHVRDHLAERSMRYPFYMAAPLPTTKTP